MFFFLFTRLTCTTKKKNGTNYANQMVDRIDSETICKFIECKFVHKRCVHMFEFSFNVYLFLACSLWNWAEHKMNRLQFTINMPTKMPHATHISCMYCLDCVLGNQTREAHHTNTNEYCYLSVRSVSHIQLFKCNV